MSDQDIESGKRWNDEIAAELDQSEFGILCVTPENIAEPWLNFEAGAISKKYDSSQVCPYLFGFSKVQVKGPLGSFQATLANKDGTQKLVSAIARKVALDTDLESLFKLLWPELDKKLKSIGKQSTDLKEMGQKATLNDSDMIQRIYSEVGRISSELRVLRSLNPEYRGLSLLGPAVLRRSANEGEIVERRRPPRQTDQNFLERIQEAEPDFLRLLGEASDQDREIIVSIMSAYSSDLPDNLKEGLFEKALSEVKKLSS